MFRSATESSVTSVCCPPRWLPASNGSIVEQDNVKGEPFADVERSLHAVRTILAA